MRAAGKAVRFSKLVEANGRPRVHALWVAPEKDRAFTRARREQRVLTVAPGGHGKADTAHVGFDPARDQGGQFLIFPKTLARFSGQRVVGVKFDLVEQPKTKSGEPTALWARSARAKGRHPAPPRTPSAAAPIEHRPTAPVRNEPAPTGGTARAPASKPPANRRRKSAAGASAGRNPKHLVAEIRTALGELRDGKTVAAYQRLERLLQALG